MPTITKPRRRAIVTPRATPAFKKFNPGCPTRNCCTPPPPLTFINCGTVTLPRANINLDITYFLPGNSQVPRDGKMAGTFDKVDPECQCAQMCNYAQITWYASQNHLTTTLVYDGNLHWQSSLSNVIYQKREFYGCGSLVPPCTSSLSSTQYWQGDVSIDLFCPGQGGGPQPPQLRSIFGVRYSADNITWCNCDIGTCISCQAYYNPENCVGGNQCHCGCSDDLANCCKTDGSQILMCCGQSLSYNANVTNPTINGTTSWTWSDAHATLST